MDKATGPGGLRAPPAVAWAPVHPRWTISPGAFRRVALAAVVAVALLIVSGAAVRLTGSGLGCSTWPKCDGRSVVAPLQAHAWIEFGNRLINALVTVAAVGALVAAWRRTPRRRDLTWLAAGLVGGLLAEIVLGGIVVYTKLNPLVVSLHFLLGLVFLAVAVVLHDRSRRPDGAPAGRLLVGAADVVLARAVLGLLAVAVALGTVVTSTGPHGGAPNAPRYHFSLHRVAQLHGSSVELLLVVTAVMLWSLFRTRAPRAVLVRAEVLLATLAAQAVVGYTQYLTGDPVAVVAVHVAGASAVVIAALHYYLGLWDRAPAVAAPARGEPAASALSSPV